ncbi:unnamed protein product [Parnassius apollo]|uniref:(apollo) hypothetical protein n=1 Tax=Parnassius apollo TaxID=110799 RepID=A0A8S3WF85_PARAO|nr:unnamed protein product [Parnassius apollo]
MKAIYTITAVLVTVANCANFNPRQDALANALQNIFSSANTEKAMNMIQMAANRQVHNPAPCKEEKIVPIATAPPNRQIVPIGAMQRPAPPNAGQVVKQAPPNIPLNLQNLAELISLNAMASQNPVMPKFTMPNMPIIITTTREVPQPPINKEVNSQFYQVTLPCLQEGMFKSNPTFAVSPRFLQAPKPPQQSLGNTNVIFSSQPCTRPTEYTITSPTYLPQSMPLPIATPAPAPCCPPSPSIEVCLPEVEPVFDFTLGCLDPILKCYGMLNEVPAASPVPPISPPCSLISSPTLPSQCSCHFLRKISIPPPFI